MRTRGKQTHLPVHARCCCNVRRARPDVRCAGTCRCLLQVGMSHISAAAAAEALPQVRASYVHRAAIKPASRSKQRTHANRFTGLTQQNQQQQQRQRRTPQGWSTSLHVCACRLGTVCAHVLQGMKDLNLRDEAARYQQAPPPQDMVSTQVCACLCSVCGAQTGGAAAAPPPPHLSARLAGTPGVCCANGGL